MYYRPIYPTFKQLTNIMHGRERKATVKPWYWKDGDPEGRIQWQIQLGIMKR